MRKTFKEMVELAQQLQQGKDERNIDTELDELGVRAFAARENEANQPLYTIERRHKEAVRRAGDKLVQEYLDNREANRPAVEMAREERDREFYDELRRDGPWER